MTIERGTFDLLHQHWAMRALGDERLLAARAAASRLYVQRNVGQYIHGSWPDRESDELIHRTATAYEVIAAEGLDDLFRAQRGPLSQSGRLAQAAAYYAFELRRALPLSSDDLRSLTYQILQLGAFAYTSDRWAEFRAWLRDRDVTPENIPDGGDDWDGKILRTLAEIWIRLLRKRGWSDLTEVGRAVAALRSVQEENEEPYLAAADENGTVKPKAWRLIALYHWARASELLAEYMMQGTPAGITAELDFHFDRAIDASQAALDAPTEVTLKWLHLLSVRMISGSLWSLTSAGRETRNLVTAKTRSALFELLPPQRTALLEQGLLDQASTAVVVDLPTSAGKTVLAEFKIVQALNQFRDEGGWVAYVAPTRALVAQITRRLRRDLSPLGIQVEQLTAAVELDDLEQQMVSQAENPFDVLVATPEKLQLLVRNSSVPRPLALLVLDEAHNIADKQRGVRIELLLATIKQDCPDANFLLLMPFVPNAEDLARWLSPQSGRSISLGTTAWQPNDRMVGLVKITPPHNPKQRYDWSIEYRTLTTSAHTLVIDESLQIGDGPTLRKTYSQVSGNLGLIAAAGARALSDRGTSIVLAQKIASTWSIARTIKENLPDEPVTDEIALVQRFLATEISPQFELIELLQRRIGVHHAGLSDEARSMMEWLAEIGQLRVLVATTTIAQGINFPVSSVFVASRHLSFKTHSEEMPARDFWNLVGRAGRVDQDSIGVVGLACRENGEDERALTRFVSIATEALASRLVAMVNDLSARGRLMELESYIYGDQWADFRSYVAHLFNQSRSLDDVLSKTELTLRNTFGYSAMVDGDDVDKAKGRALLDATRKYAESLSRAPQNAKLADSTGFAPESVRAATQELRHLERSLTKDDWQPESLFGASNSALPELMGVLMKMPQVRESIEDLAPGRGAGVRAAEITIDWVNGTPIQDIAERYFMREGDMDATKALTETCRSIYRNLVMAGTWGISALSKMPSAGIDFERMPESEIRRINLLGAMIYHGVSTEGGVAMRMAAVPRSMADSLGRRAVAERGRVPSAGEARAYLEGLPLAAWEEHRPASAAMSGEDYRRAWRILAGEPDS
ncbi:DEAD/DEAH box helicase [Streptomyces lavendofoliae]|uniref:DEAD/DEAH box helicase n=1 Tax=Streptomyces lavendofoliae TaxID=67314 RepID=UPI00300EBFF2